MPCGSKLSYTVRKECLKCNVNKAYISVQFIRQDLDDPYLEYETLSEFLPDTLDWQESKSAGTISAAMDSYNCVDVIINTEA